MKMIRRIGLLVMAGIFALWVAPAFPYTCERLHTTVTLHYNDTAKKPGVDQSKLASAKKLLDKGIEAHGRGNHGDAVGYINEAMRLIEEANPR